MHKHCSCVILAIAVLIALLASVLPQSYLSYVVFVVNFFDVMLPILAVGALVKYISCCNK